MTTSHAAMHSASVAVLLLLAWGPANTRSQESEFSEVDQNSTAESPFLGTARDALSCPAVCPACPGCPACPAAPACARHIPPGYRQYGDLGYYKMHYESKNWNDAKASCEDEGGYLVVLNSQDEANLASGFLNKYNISTKLLIGMFDVTTKGTFITVLGDDVSSTGYDMWAPGEPNHLGLNIENCGSLNPNLGINDEYCTSNHPFLCELFT